MELYDEEDLKNNKKKSNKPLILTITTIALGILSIIIILLIVYLSGSITTIKINGENRSKLEQILYIVPGETEASNKLYIPIKEIAPYLNYSGYNGDFQNKSEDQTKCYVQNEFETAMFTLNSKTLIRSRGDADYEYIDLDEAVFEKDGILYTTIEGIEQACNVSIRYNSEKRKIDIYTMDYLVQHYASKFELEDYEPEFINQKAVFENMLVIEEDKKFGVVEATTGNDVLEMKYDGITYLPNTKEFIVKSNEKYGIVSKNTDTVVKTIYDEIKIMDNENGLYLVKRNNLYGVIDLKGNVIIEPEHNQIGINNIKSYIQNGVENQYVLLGEIIPVVDDEKWTLYNIKGEKISEEEFDGLGCTKSQVSASYPTIVVPSYKLIVVKKGDYFNLMNTEGKLYIGGNGKPIYVVDSVYMKTEAGTGKNTFYMTYNGNTKDIEEMLTSLGE